jgi:Protein of unknown function (DUF2946)
MKRKAAAWAAILSMAFNTLWPLCALANPGPQDPVGAEVCTAHGMVAVFDGDLQLPGPGGAAQRLTPHCAFCSLGAAHALLDTASPLALDMEQPAHHAPATYRFAPRPWFVTSSLRSRSPPV